MAFCTFLLEGIKAVLHQIVNSTVCSMFHALCLHTVLFSQLTVTKYCTGSTGLQENYMPAKVELCKALNEPTKALSHTFCG